MPGNDRYHITARATTSLPPPAVLATTIPTTATRTTDPTTREAGQDPGHGRGRNQGHGQDLRAARHGPEVDHGVDHLVLEKETRKHSSSYIVTKSSAHSQ